MRKRKNQKDTDRNSMIPYVPDHLRHLLIDPPSDETCEWQLSGPQFPPPTAIQQRYCYPKGPEEYSSRKGGALWTMYGNDGKEDLEFRLLHVYYSAKRALNKGIDAKPTSDVALRMYSSAKYQHVEEREQGQQPSINTSSVPPRRRIDKPMSAEERYNAWESHHSRISLRQRNDLPSHNFAPMQSHRSNASYGLNSSTSFYQNINYSFPYQPSYVSAPYQEIQNSNIFRSQPSIPPCHEQTITESSSPYNDVMCEATMSFSFSEDSIETNPESVTRDVFGLDLDDDDAKYNENRNNDSICVIQNPDMTNTMIEFSPSRIESLSENLDLFKKRILDEIMNEPDKEQPALLNKLITWGQQLASETVDVDTNGSRSQTATPSPVQVPDHTFTESKTVDETFLNLGVAVSDSVSDEIAVSRSDLDNDIDNIIITNNKYINNNNDHDDNNSQLDFLNLNGDYDNYDLNEHDILWVPNHSSSSSFDGEANHV
jgi:hypothetical protein